MADISAKHFLLLCVLCSLYVTFCDGACAEVDSDTEAVAGEDFKVGCISCKVRGEVEATAKVKWYFSARGESEYVCIFSYDGQESAIYGDQFADRILWGGSKNTLDLQDASINILNVTFNDSGIYRCAIDRTLSYECNEYEATVFKLVNLNVVGKATRGTASIVSEVMMYVSIIGLQLWLLVEMIYCYRKIAAAGEEALRASAAEYLAIASESKDNCAGVQVAE